ncbi:MAG: CRISPR-associated RAMP family protein [Candidatus Parcubacteria bacterium]|nr:MAG: CRISPR-associated RAMP family protein [Candidatus Parcubacteria bacterium]
MEQKKVKISIVKTKKGYDVVLEGINQKADKRFNIPESLNGKEATVFREGNKILKIICEGKEYTVQENSSKNQDIKSQNSDINADVKAAKAPYNFVPLNHSVVETQQAPDFDKYHNDRYTGHIDLEIETLTPLYIRNTNEKGESDPDFFNINGQYKIPGSSLRGMIRTLVEIVSFGKFHYYDDERLYYRGLADISNLRKIYQQKINKKVNAGYLNYDSGKKQFYVIPVQSDSINQLGYEKIKDTTKEFDYNLQDDGCWIVWSGKMGNTKKYNWRIYPPDFEKEKIYISNKDIDYYKKDLNRNIPIDILKSAKEKYLFKNNDHNDEHKIEKIRFENGVPIFFVKYIDSNNEERIAFGHTRYFRLPYEKTIGDHIPENLHKNNSTDFAEAIFGKEDKWASRVFFEDADLLDNPENAFLPNTSPKILSEPKPTTFQHYLEQPENANKSNLNHWDSEAKIRGYKLYWHRNTPSDSNEPFSWNEGREIYDDTQHTVIRPVKKNKKFKGRIRFENLSKEELGALLFVLNLPENCYHKLGMGKPLGLGSVKITSNLTISNRKQRYSKLFDDNNSFYLPEENQNPEEFTKAFEKYILNKISDLDRGNAQNLWDTPRLNELKHLLDWSKTKQSLWNEKTRYMEIEHPQNGNEFRNRPVLKKPSKY